MQPRLLLLLASLALAFPGLALPAEAQVPAPGTTEVILTMDIRDPGAPLVPVRPYALEVLVRYQYGTGGVTGSGIGRVLPVPPPGDPQDDPCAEITILEAPVWANSTVLNPIVCFPIPPTFAAGSGNTVTNVTFVEVNATSDAPSLEPAVLRVQAHAPAQGVFAEDTAEANRTVMAAYLGRLQVSDPDSVQLQGGETTRVPITVQNLANGPIEVRFRNNFTAPQGLRVTVPQRFTIPAPGEEQVVYVTLQAPWTGPVKGQVQLLLDSVHPQHPDLVGEAPRISFDVQGRAALPGPGAEAMVLALAACALLAARRQR